MSYPLPWMNTRNSPLITALAAVGLAAVLNIRFSPQMELRARKKYTNALSQTNYALRNPIRPRTDDTSMFGGAELIPLD